MHVLEENFRIDEVKINVLGLQIKVLKQISKVLLIEKPS